MPAPDERQLVQLAGNGDHEAFRMLVERYMKQAYNIAFGVVNNHEDAEDVAQDAFVRIYHSLKSFRGDSEFSTWMYRIVMNLSLNRVKQLQKQMRRTRRSEDIEMVPAAPEPSHSGLLDARLQVERALHELPTLQRAVVILRHLDGLSTRQVSSILKCSQGTVKTHLHRGLKKMKLMLKSLEHDLI
jgi:RNA polymerase sigma-70 factor (ECF subfamily)